MRTVTLLVEALSLTIQKLWLGWQVKRIQQQIDRQKVRGTDGP